MHYRLRRFAKAVRGGLVRLVRPAAITESTEPVSRAFGLERGQPIDRYYIERFLAGAAENIRGEALEVGEVRYLTDFGRGLTRRAVIVPTIEAARHTEMAQTVIAADLSALPAEFAGQFDTFVCTQTLNFIEDVEGAIDGAWSLLRPGGTLIGTVSGIAQISRYDADRWGDYWRFTPQGLDTLLRRRFGDEMEIVAYGNLAAAVALLRGLAVEDLSERKILDLVDPDYPMILGFIARRSGTA